jgi:septum formation topological specificity factor MinE
MALLDFLKNKKDAEKSKKTAKKPVKTSVAEIKKEKKVEKPALVEKTAITKAPNSKDFFMKQ